MTALHYAVLFSMPALKAFAFPSRDPSFGSPAWHDPRFPWMPRVNVLSLASARTCEDVGPQLGKPSGGLNSHGYAKAVWRATL